MKLKKINADTSKVKMIKELQNLMNQYYLMVEKLSSIFIDEKEKNELIEEINLLETSLRSKLLIVSLMRGF